VAKDYFEDALKGGGIPPPVVAQVQGYLAEIARRTPYDYALFLQSGARYQTNATVGPDSSIVRSLGQDAVLGSQFARGPDWNWFQIAALNFAYRWGRTADALEVTLLGYYARQNHFRQFDLGLIEAYVGPRIYLNRTTSIKPYVIGDLVWLGEAPYFQAIGGGGSLRWRYGDNVFVETYVEERHRRFFDSASFPTSSQQTGDLLSAGIAAELRYGFVRWLTRLTYDHNNAVFSYNTYDRWSVDVGLPLEFYVPFAGTNHQIVFTPTAGYSDTPYKDPNVLIDPLVTRHDKEVRVGGILDVQLYGSFGLRTQVTQTWVHSTLVNFTTKNFTVAFGPTARFAP
jgi:hypothetical protein